MSGLKLELGNEPTSVNTNEIVTFPRRIGGLLKLFWKDDTGADVKLRPETTDEITEGNNKFFNEQRVNNVLLTPLYSKVRDDFISSTTAGNLAWANSINGTGAGATVIAPPTADSCGVVQLSTGITTTGRASLYLPSNLMAFGGFRTRLSWLVRLPQLGNALNSFSATVGFGDTTTLLYDHADGAYFKYDYSLSAALWRIVTANNSIRTDQETAVVVQAGGWALLQIDVKADGTLAEFYINGTLAGSIDSNIPIDFVNRLFGPICKIESRLGTTAKLLHIDYFAMEIFR